MADITRKSSRVQLPVRREPYWLRLAPGAALGFRRGPNTWIAKYNPRRGGKREYKSLTGAVEYDEAKKAAEEWLAQLSGSPVRSARRGTVRAGLETYLADLRRHGRSDAATEAEGRFKLTVYGDRIADLKLEEATQDDFLEWRDRLRLDKTGKRRQPRSINRHVRSVRAGLNRARKLGHIGNPEAWQLIPLADDKEDEAETAVFLEPSQRRAIMEKADLHLAKFLRGLELTGARPKELAAATVGDLDLSEDDGSVIRLQHRKGKPAKLRTRYTVLDTAGTEFFAAQRKGKLPSARLFTMDGELPWTNHDWARSFRTAVAKVNETAKGADRIPIASKAKGKQGASAYSFRHARISELLQIHGIDPLTVAAQTGTSVAMIEKNYFKFIPSAMRAKLESVRTS